MSAAKFTPGPWKLAPHDPHFPDEIRIESPDGSWDVAIIPIEPADVESTIVDHANARLIAAAPELYAAAEATYNALVADRDAHKAITGIHAEDCDGECWVCDLLRTACRALAKARGEAAA